MEEICAVHNRPYEKYRQMANGLLELHCSWDGSLHPDVFMRLIEQPGTTLTPTDKNYKVYIELESDEHAEELRIMSLANHDMSSEPGWQRIGDTDLTDVDVSGWRQLNDNSWIRLARRGSKITDKFYFEHLSIEQRERFVKLLNEKKLALNYPGYFYALPFFVINR